MRFARLRIPTSWSLRIIGRRLILFRSINCTASSSGVSSATVRGSEVIIFDFPAVRMDELVGKPAGPNSPAGERASSQRIRFRSSARMYMPALGRFLQPDPIGYGGGRHLYAYIGNDPLNGVDPPRLYDNPNQQSDASPNPVPPGEQYAQAGMALCAAGPPGCVVGTGITAGQIIGGIVAGTAVGGAILGSQQVGTVTRDTTKVAPERFLVERSGT
jgi:RHS repeat-associated protein